MSKIEENKPSTAGEATKKAAEGSAEHAPTPVLLPLAFLLAIGLIVAYGIMSK